MSNIYDILSTMAKLNSLSSIQNLSGMVQQYANLTEPIVKSVDFQPILKQMPQLTVLLSETASVKDSISAAQNIVRILPHIESLNATYSTKALLSSESINDVTQGIHFQNGYVSMSSSAQHVLDLISEPDSSPESPQPISPIVADADSAHISDESTLSTVKIPNADFIKTYAIKLAQFFFSNLMALLIAVASTELTNDIPLIISAIENAAETITDSLERYHTEYVEIENRKIDSINQMNHWLQQIAENTAIPQITPADQTSEVLSGDEPLPIAPAPTQPEE